MIPDAAGDIDRDRLAAVCHRYGIASLSVFGSVARGAAGEDSDIDLLYELRPGARLGWEVDDLADEPHMMFDHLDQEIHGRYLGSCGQPQAARWMEMHAVGAVELDVAVGSAPPLRRPGAVRALERPGERLVGRVARLDGDVEHPCVADPCEAHHPA